jgi:hypothetical protein
VDAYFSKTFVDESLGLIFATRFQKRSGSDLGNKSSLVDNGWITSVMNVNKIHSKNWL